MNLTLNAKQKEYQAEFKAFSDEEVAPFAEQFDREEKVSPEIIAKLAQRKYLGAIAPEDVGGLGADMITFGILNEEVGRGCSSVRSLLTVHSMVLYAIMRWGTEQQKQTWLPKLATGETIGAFALTEPEIGSDAKNISTTATDNEDVYILNGQKKWITYAQIADIFLVFVQCDGKPLALLVEAQSEGLEIKPMHGLLGTRASMLAELHFNDCAVPKSNKVGGVGFGFLAVASSALDVGRYSVACGSVGIGQACVEASLNYAAERIQFGKPLKNHQLIQKMLTDMITNVKAARLLCYQAGYLKDINDASATTETLVAKYFASTIVNKVASDAVQIQGANGCSDTSAVQRYFRDAKIMEIIEGSSQIQQILIAKNLYDSL